MQVPYCQPFNFNHQNPPPSLGPRLRANASESNPRRAGVDQNVVLEMVEKPWKTVTKTMNKYEHTMFFLFHQYRNDWKVGLPDCLARFSTCLYLHLCCKRELLLRRWDADVRTCLLKEETKSVFGAVKGFLPDMHRCIIGVSKLGEPSLYGSVDRFEWSQSIRVRATLAVLFSDYHNIQVG